jgi:hypothetical protein
MTNYISEIRQTRAKRSRAAAHGPTVHRINGLKPRSRYFS